MNKQIIYSREAPDPIGPYSQAVKAAGLLFISGQVALQPGTSAFINDDIKKEVTQVMENLKNILTQAGLGFQHVIKTTIFLKEMNLFAEVNEIYSSYFEKEFPARETVAVKGLPKDANVEISMIAVEQI